MPFMPILTPALGPSLLKAGLELHGIGCDLFYGSMELLQLFAEDAPADALFDYSYLASSEDLGEVFFAPAMWPATLGSATSELATIPLMPRLPYQQEKMILLADRLLRNARRRDEFFERCLAARDWPSYRIVGFSSTFSQNNSSLHLARLIKRAAPHVTVVFGGANCDGEMGEQLLRSFSWVDHVVQGEADSSLPRYARAVLAGQEPGPLPGLLRRDPNGRVYSGSLGHGPPPTVQSLDELPQPDFADYFIQRAAVLGSHEVSIPIEFSRGCWWGAIQHCVFCGLNPNGMAFRSKSPSSAVREISALAERWNADSVMVVDNIIDMEYFTDVLPHISDLGLALFCETKSNLREEHVAALARAGVRDIQPGIESINTATLRHMRKGARASTQVQLLKWCAEHGVRPLWFYLYGFPGEQQQWYVDDVALFPLLHHLPPPRNPNPIVIDRFSPLFDNPDEYGLRNIRPAWRADISYAGLPEEARARISYHFNADFPDGGVRTYEAQLWDAVNQWRERYRNNAFLHQTTTRDSTLVVDGRKAGKPVAHLLTGIVHNVYRAVWSARNCDQVAVAVDRDRDRDELVDPTVLSASDVDVSLRAVTLGARLVEATATVRDPRSVLEMLEDLHLVVRLDDRWLALATTARETSG